MLYNLLKFIYNNQQLSMSSKKIASLILILCTLALSVYSININANMLNLNIVPKTLMHYEGALEKAVQSQAE